MNKESFNNLSVIKQIDFFNTELEKGRKISKICKGLGMSYNVIRDRFQANRFTYNKLLNKFECVENIFPLDEEIINKALLKLVNQVFTADKNNTKLNINKFNSNIVNRSFRVREEVLEDFTSFCNSSNLKQYDILTQFIVDGLNKYAH